MQNCSISRCHTQNTLPWIVHPSVTVLYHACRPQPIPEGLSESGQATSLSQSNDTSHAHIQTSELPITLMVMSLDCGRKSEYLERTAGKLHMGIELLRLLAVRQWCKPLRVRATWRSEGASDFRQNLVFSCVFVRVSWSFTLLLLLVCLWSSCLESPPSLIVCCEVQ